MQSYINRLQTARVAERLKHLPAVALLGPRQVGKSTLVKQLLKPFEKAIYLDLERPADLNKLRDPEAYFALHTDKLICLDEIQRTPELFPLLRSVIDVRGRNGQFLILGSASPTLIKQSSETLAGRIAYLELTPLLLYELEATSLRNLWLRGGFPRSYLSTDDKASFEWRLDFIRTFLERDISQLGFALSAKVMERFWRFCAHSHGHLLNSSKLGSALGMSHHTIRGYIDLLEQTFMLRSLPPYEANLKKRLVKAPKIYLRDSGLLHALLGVESQDDLFSHPCYGSSWEGFVIENILALHPEWRASFYRTSSGSEIDLILERGRRRVAIECKASTSPEVGRGFWSALKDLEITEAWIIAPVDTSYPIESGVTVAPLSEFIVR
ncbi:MAG: hypothetical protein FD130_323 [Halothiobacillaceae bacterium]|nr:MAG: hypothetical protein FD130_323 [Halothiobacillaceae bacterium]